MPFRGKFDVSLIRRPNRFAIATANVAANQIHFLVSSHILTAWVGTA
jgi:hypothetical protein